MTLKIDALYRYPVKGLSPERLDVADLATGAFFPGDRAFAIEDGPSGFDADHPQWQPKTKYLMLMRDEALARLRTRYDDATATLRIEEGGREVVRADLSTQAGRDEIASFMDLFLPPRRGPRRLLRATDSFRFTDSTKGFVSILNLASIQALEALIGAPVDPMRFRANVHVTGLDPWAEHDMVDQALAGPEGLVLKVIKRIDRCAATNVHPESGIRDLNIPKTLMRHLGHIDCGVYVRVVRGGTLRIGDELTLEQTTLISDPSGRPALFSGWPAP